jgi:hypothetical protein
MIACFPWRMKLYGFAEPTQALCENKLARKTFFLIFAGAIAILRTPDAERTVGCGTDLPHFTS